MLPQNLIAQIVNKRATKETKNFYQNLMKLTKIGVMFGHQDDLAYGVKWHFKAGESDVKQVVNDYPAVFGWEISGIENKKEKNIDGVPFDKMRGFIKQVYDKGSVNTISWHLPNPKTLGSAWDTTKAVSTILPDSINNKLYKKWLRRVASFMRSLKGSDGKHIPILFRPFHELNGGWFWWGSPHCTPEEYKSLWKYTIEYLQRKRVKNLVYVYNTNSFNTAQDFMERYPEDKWVDVISFDSYEFAPNNANDAQINKASALFKQRLKNNLELLDSISKIHHKLAALAETGFETIPDRNWWTQTLWDAVKDYNISYLLVWRNHGWQEKEQKMHYYAPFDGQISAPDFEKFYQLDRTLFGKDVANYQLYRKNNIKNQ